MDEIEFPQSVCINSQPHGPHRIAGTWRTECPGLEEELRGVPNEPNTWKPRSPEVSGRWAGASDAERGRLLDLAHDQALNEDATRNSPRALALAAVADVWRTINAPEGFRPVDVRPLLDRIEQALTDRRPGREPFYTPAAGDADLYNEQGQPTGYVHRSAG
jgi:hypothetical protein